MTGKLRWENSAGVHSSWSLPILSKTMCDYAHIINVTAPFSSTKKVILRAPTMCDFDHTERVILLALKGDFSRTERVILLPPRGWLWLPPRGWLCSHQAGDFALTERVILRAPSADFAHTEKMIMLAPQCEIFIASIGWFYSHQFKRLILQTPNKEGDFSLLKKVI